MNKIVRKNAVYQGVHETAEITGLPVRLLYDGAKSGRYPHIKSGVRILYNVPRLLEVLELEAVGSKEGMEQ